MRMAGDKAKVNNNGLVGKFTMESGKMIREKAMASRLKVAKVRFTRASGKMILGTVKEHLSRQVVKRPSLVSGSTASYMAPLKSKKIMKQ